MKIQIIGTTSSGKSIVAEVIRRALEEYGADVHLNTLELPSIVPIEKYKDILSDKRIDIVEIQANKSICE